MKEVETIQNFFHNIHREKWGISNIPVLYLVLQEVRMVILT